MFFYGVGMSTRYLWVDYAKALGIILVVVGHVSRGIYLSDISVEYDFFWLMDSVIYSFHMPLFFFLSGLFFRASLLNKGGGFLLLEKAGVIVYPYVLWSLMQGLIELFLSQYTNGNVTYVEIFSLLTDPRAQFWFLYSLFMIYLISVLASFMELFFLKIVFFLVSVVLYIYQSSIGGVLNMDLISGGLVFFLVGSYSSKVLDYAPLAKLRYVCLCTGLFVVSQYLYHFVFDLKYSDKGIASLLLSFVSICKFLSRKTFKIFVLIGSMSMAIFLMHILAGSGVRIVLYRFFHVDDYSLHLVVGSLFGVFVPVVFFVVMKNFNLSFMFSINAARLVGRFK